MKEIHINVNDFGDAALAYDAWVKFLEKRLIEAGFDLNRPIRRYDDPASFGACSWRQEDTP